jgi:shikimate 5-dehydrogenase
MKKIQYKLPAYRIVGVLNNGHNSHTTARTLERRIRLRVRDVVCLPFAVEQKYFKNLVACMKLMDVEGLVVDVIHGRHVMRELSSVDKNARTAGFVDTVTRNGKAFRGTCSWAQALIHLAGNERSRTILVVGETAEALAATRVLANYRTKRTRSIPTTRLRDLPAHSLVVDFSGESYRMPRNVQRVTKHALDRAHRQIMVDTLANSLS